MAVVISAFDLATRLIGVCAGSSAEVPDADAWPMPDFGEDWGKLGHRFRRFFMLHVDRYDPDVVLYEAPILITRQRTDRAGRPVGRPPDKIDKIRRLYGLGFLLETLCEEVGETRGRPLPCREADVSVVKKELAGHRWADKDAMVASARKLGVELPATKAAGMEDAADAVGVWLVGVRVFAKSDSTEWDRKLYSSRGKLNL